MKLVSLTLHKMDYSFSIKINYRRYLQSKLSFWRLVMTGNEAGNTWLRELLQHVILAPQHIIFSLLFACWGFTLVPLTRSGSNINNELLGVCI